MVAGDEAEANRKQMNVAPSGTIPVTLQLDPGTVQVIAELSAKLNAEPAEVLGEALTFFSAVKQAHDDGGQVIVPSGVMVTKFKQEIRLP